MEQMKFLKELKGVIPINHERAHAMIDEQLYSLELQEKEKKQNGGSQSEGSRGTTGQDEESRGNADQPDETSDGGTKETE